MRFIIVTTNKTVARALETELEKVNPFIPHAASVSVVHGSLAHYLHAHKVNGTTAIVSPANSLSYMGGGFDRAILETLTGQSDFDYKLLEAAIQRKALDYHNGYIVPGSVHKVDLESAYRAANINFHTTVAWHKRVTTLVQAPTMVVPEPILGTRVFDTMWSILVESRSVADSVVLPALGAGYGMVDPGVVGQAMAGAIGIFFWEMPPLARSVAILLFTGKDYRKLGLPLDIAELEQYLTPDGVHAASSFPMPWDKLVQSMDVKK